jgi:hypothetical protein
VAKREIVSSLLVKLTAEEYSRLAHLERADEGKAGTLRRAVLALHELEHEPRIAVVSLRKPPFLPSWVSRAPTTITRAVEVAEAHARKGYEVRLDLLPAEPPLPIIEPEITLGAHFEGDDD